LDDSFLGLRSAVVQQAGTPLALVQEVIGAVADQHDARALRHVQVVRDVDDELGEEVLLDPAVKHRDEGLRGNGVRRFGSDEDLEL
jgi:hypothetical protein